MCVPGPKPRDAEDVPMYRVGDRLCYRPGARAINGLKRIDAYLETGEEEQLEQALKQADRLRRHPSSGAMPGGGRSNYDQVCVGRDI